jgi:hypothetical protein
MNAPCTLVDAWDYRVLVEADASDVRRRFPGVAVWFGGATGRWWAVIESVPGHSQLVEAGNPYDLCRLIDSARAALSHRGAVEISARPVASPPDRPRGSRRRGRHSRRRRGSRARVRAVPGDMEKGS